jgi:hypothetical protein
MNALYELIFGVFSIIASILVVIAIIRRGTRADENIKVQKEIRDKLNKVSNQHKQKQLDVCANCGRTIGKLESPCVFNGNIVCEECDQILRKKSV